MSRGLVALIGLLAVASAVFIALMALVVVTFKLFPPHDKLTFDQAFWYSLLRTLDPGTMGGDQGDGFRLAMLLVTIVGLILVASLIGIVSNSFNNKVDQLRKGKSRVLEANHTLILGWNSKVFTLLHEIAIANKSKAKSVVVILAEKDKVEMEDEIRAKVADLFGTRVIARNGDPLNLLDLKIANPEKARSIIILSSESETDSDADSATIKTCLALLNSRKDQSHEYHIVGEIRNEANIEAARIVGGDQAHWVLGDDLMSRIIVQTCRQMSLSKVFTELLDFNGSEIYLNHQPQLVGKQYGEAIKHFGYGCAFGIISGMNVELNPSSSRVVNQNDLFLVIAEDQNQIKLAKGPAVEPKKFSNQKRKPQGPEKTLILGTNKKVAEIIREMNKYMAKGSEVVIVADHPVAKLPKFGNLKVTYIEADSTSQLVIADLGVTKFHHIVVLADRERFSTQQADARTLLTLLHLRELAKQKSVHLNIVSEMLDDRNRELAESTNADDFIVSDKLVCLMLAQIEESPEVSHVFAELLSGSGTEIMLHPIEWYVKTDSAIDFDTLVAAAIEQGESAIGLSISNLRADNSVENQVVLNPDRKTNYKLKSGDRLIVVSNK
ncbi:MAG: CASTOR/POLLUX-related putative ion channel [Micrococcales bacterium]